MTMATTNSPTVISIDTSADRRLSNYVIAAGAVLVLAAFAYEGTALIAFAGLIALAAGLQLTFRNGEDGRADQVVDHGDYLLVTRGKLSEKVSFTDISLAHDRHDKRDDRNNRHAIELILERPNRFGSTIWFYGQTGPRAFGLGEERSMTPLAKELMDRVQSADSAKCATLDQRNAVK